MEEDHHGMMDGYREEGNANIRETAIRKKMNQIQQSADVGAKEKVFFLRLSFALVPLALTLVLVIVGS